MTSSMLPLISTCSADGCAYNHDHDCHASAITVTGPSCGTYVESDTAGGGPDAGHVGACHRVDCVHNSALECGADHVEIGGSDVADCLTFATA